MALDAKGFFSIKATILFSSFDLGGESLIIEGRRDGGTGKRENAAESHLNDTTGEL